MTLIHFTQLILVCDLLVKVTSSTSGNLPAISTEISAVKNISEQLRLPHIKLYQHERNTTESLSPKLLQEFLSFLYSISPPHLFYLLYDNTFQEIDTSIKSHYSKTGTEYTVVKFPTDLDPLHDILSSRLEITNTARRHILVLCSMQNIATIFKMVALKNVESPWIWWVVVVVEEEAMQVLQSVLREGSQVIVVQMLTTDGCKLFISKVDSNRKVGLQTIGSWMMTPSGYHSQLSESLFLEYDKLYSNFEGRQLLVKAGNIIPFIFMEEQSDGRLLPVSGFEYRILEALSDTLNFRYSVTTPVDGKWGGPLENGTVIGMIGEVSRREADFAISMITITRSRETVIDFTYPYYTESLMLTSRSPKEKNRAFAVLSPFSSEVWFCIAVSALAIGPFLSVETWIVNKYQQRKPQDYTMNNFLFNMFRSLVKQENLLSSAYWPHKFTFLFWYLFCLVISVLYSGILISSLVTPSFEKPIDSLSDLPDAIKNGFTLGVIGDTSNEYLFKDAKEGIYKDTWNLFNHKDRSKSFLPSDVSFDMMLDQKLVIVFSQISAQFRSIKKGINRYHFGRETFAPQNYGIVCFTGAPFIHKFNKLISYMVEGGLITKWINDEFQKVAASNTYEDITGPRPFSLTHLQAAFYILLFGFLAAAIALIGELISARI